MFVLDDDILRRGVTDGASVRSLAVQSGGSVDAVRTRLRELGLETRRQRAFRAGGAARADAAAEVLLTCPTHGARVHRPDTRGTYRCPACNADRVARRRKAVKELLLDEAGGRCTRCGYDRCSRALGFHHTDPAAKSFGIALGGVTRSLDRTRAEAAKCVLLCANCHMEVESGLSLDLELGGWDSNPQPPD